MNETSLQLVDDPLSFRVNQIILFEVMVNILFLALSFIIILLVQPVHATPYSPFNEKAFDPGWKGDFLFANSDIKIRGVLTNSFDFRKRGKDKLVLNLRMYGKGKYCVGELKESSRSPDGMTLYLNPSSDNPCKNDIAKVSIVVLDTKKLRVEIHGKNDVLGTSTLWPHNGQVSLQMTRPEAEKKITPKKQVVTTTTNSYGTVISQTTKEIPTNNQKNLVSVSKEEKRALEENLLNDYLFNASVSKIPSSLVGFFSVSKKGYVLRFDGENKLLSASVELPSKLAMELGVKRNDLFGTAVYEPKTGLLKKWQIIRMNKKLAHKYRHCGDIYAPVIKYQVKPIILKDGTMAQGMWELHPLDKRYCIYHQTRASSCKIVSCSKYEATVKRLLIADKESAVAIGKVNRSQSKGKSYAEHMREARSSTSGNNATVNKSGKSIRNPSYWEAGGDCGSISCYDQTVNETNQFLIDYYW